MFKKLLATTVAMIFAAAAAADLGLWAGLRIGVGKPRCRTFGTIRGRTGDGGS